MSGGSSVSFGSLTPNRRKLKKREPFYRISGSSWLGSRAFDVYESRYIKMNEYNIGMSEFLVKLLNKELYCDIFPDDFILDKNFYNRID